MKRLAENYNERRIGNGTAEHGRVLIELWGSVSGTFTIMIVRPNGIACLAAAGSNWRWSDGVSVIIGDPA